ncbi:MAG: chorismate mutase [Verrucomicrobia bacterium]|nr:chorismate mutase [Verrucomicrobiota bacterium]
MTLDELRAEIDAIDAQIVELLSRRAASAVQVGMEKRRLGMKVCDPSREDNVLAKVVERRRSPLTEDGAWNIYREIISVCSQLQADLEDA